MRHVVVDDNEGVRVPYCSQTKAGGGRCRVWLRHGIDCGRHSTVPHPAAIIGHAPDMTGNDPFGAAPQPVAVPSRLRACCDSHDTQPVAVTPGSTWLFDLDGTLVDVTGLPEKHRLDAKRSRDRNLIGFHEDGLAAPANQDVVELSQQVAAAGGTVLITTAREGLVGRASAFWLHDHDVPYTDIYHRAYRDHRRDDLVKADLLAEIRRHGHTVERAVDDNPPVVAGWCQADIPTLQVPHDRWDR